MRTFCIEDTTDILNLTFCKSCYKEQVESPLKVLDESANLELWFGGK